MKKFLITSLFVLSALTASAQFDTTKYKAYKVCPDCSENWTITKKNSSSQDYNLAMNNMALQTKQKTNNFVRVLGGIVATVFIGTFTAIVINKSNNIANNATR